MPEAREQLRTAVRALVGRGPQRERILHAYAYALRDLDPASLPASVRDELAGVLLELGSGRGPLTVRFERFSDEQLDSMARAVLRAHDAAVGLEPG